MDDQQKIEIYEKALYIVKEAGKKDTLNAIDAEFNVIKPEKETVNEPA